MIRECKICGKPFEASRSRVCCSDKCIKKNKSLLSQANYEKTYIPKKTKRKRKDNAKSNYNAIRDLTIEAREHGMSYGQYVGLLIMKGELS